MRNTELSKASSRLLPPGADLNRAELEVAELRARKEEQLREQAKQNQRHAEMRKQVAAALPKRIAELTARLEADWQRAIDTSARRLAEEQLSVEVGLTRHTGAPGRIDPESVLRTYRSQP